MNTYTIKQIQFFEKNVRTNTFSTNKCAFLKRFKWRFKLFILNLGAGGGVNYRKMRAWGAPIPNWALRLRRAFNGGQN